MLSCTTSFKYSYYYITSILSNWQHPHPTHPNSAFTLYLYPHLLAWHSSLEVHPTYYDSLLLHNCPPSLCLCSLFWYVVYIMCWYTDNVALIWIWGPLRVLLILGPPVRKEMALWLDMLWIFLLNIVQLFKLIYLCLKINTKIKREYS